ncbi:TetR/AcrR family transcriptional regulator [Lentzea albida]|uniref:Transcriptional regulator, TetR family n=1 Tax=Lentzea albida TaxID=65499 RepID=A0A1H9EDL4_9PSEU|nr:TetR/AcrR family transcriptional regulator [Lentzea albida]SEQ23729.1 transcriptional regulator, TetR family [Lentzea albida]
MPRQPRTGVDEKILDAAAALFARHGFEQTSLKSLADAVGLSKAGLLHHFPSKDALFEAAWAQSRIITQHVLDLVKDLPAGPERDRRSLELLTDYALDRPGMVALLFRSMTAPGEDPQQAQDELLLNEMFVIDPAAELPRAIRIVGALSAMAVLTLLANQEGDKTLWRPLILATCYDALGHQEA